MCFKRQRQHKIYEFSVAVAVVVVSVFLFHFCCVLFILDIKCFLSNLRVHIIRDIFTNRDHISTTTCHCTMCYEYEIKIFWMHSKNKNAWKVRSIRSHYFSQTFNLFRGNNHKHYEQLGKEYLIKKKKNNIKKRTYSAKS